MLQNYPCNVINSMVGHDGNCRADNFSDLMRSRCSDRDGS